MVKKADWIWMDGKFVRWDEANVHVLTHSLHYGLAAFEGIRCYKTEDGRAAVWALKAHIRRLFESAHILGMKIGHSREEIARACVETLKRNDQREGYIRPLVYLGVGAMGVFPADNPVRVAIATWPWGAYLGEDALKKGIRAKVSSFTRMSVNAFMTKAKATGSYINGVVAKMEARKLGYEEAILLDAQGYVAEGTGENTFAVRDGEIRTTPTASILRGITRETIMEIAREKGYPILEARITRDELYTADEVFFTGTAAEVTPIREIDDRTIGTGSPGPVTLALQKAYFDAVYGRDEKRRRMLTYLDAEGGEIG